MWYHGRRWRLVLGVDVMLVLGGQMVMAEPLEPLSISVRNYAQVPRDVLQTARDAVNRMLRPAGVLPVWKGCGRDDGRPPHAFALNVLPEDMAAKLSPIGDALGIAPGRPGEDNYVAYTFYARVKRFAEVESVGEGLVLGGVIAHEIGHLLLPFDSHSRSGVMRWVWDRKHLLAAVQGGLNFGAEQIRLIKRRVARMKPLKALSLSPPSAPVDSYDEYCPVVQQRLERLSTR